MNPVLNVAVRDVIESIKTKRLLVTLFIFVFIGIGTAHWVRYLLMSSPTGDEQFIKDAMANSFLNNLRNFLALLSILFGADAINREIETGTIRVTLGHPIYRDQFLIGKFLGKALTVMVGLTLFVVISVASMLLIGIPIGGGVVMLILKPLPFFVLFSLVYVSLGVLLSVLVRKSSTSILLALLLALFLEMIYPIAISVIISLKVISTGMSPELLGEMIQRMYRFLIIQPGFYLKNIWYAFGMRYFTV
ncbi:MAG TPA: hypothetical protein EYH13_03515 [Thermococcus paralvinellae]|uniref:ABC transporter permease n=1 Tax=Thermococcus paralvinellae TaxID=582419 RepID=A0A833DZ26_9EURY|nr:hypothetical protein [Thermococcus paralvinellae]